MVGCKFLVLFFLLHKAAGAGGNTIRSGEIKRLIKVGSTVKMEDYPRTGYRPLGFSIDVFMYAMKSLSMDFEWEVYPRGDGHNYYDRLVQQAADEVYDVIAADVTITAKRAEIVEFSHPFSDSDIAMVVVAEHENDTNKPWWFLRPMSLPLWVATLGIILLKGVLIFIFERGVDKKYGGDILSQQMGRILSLSFTTFIFADCSELKSFYSRIVSILWAFLLFIVAAGYTANLASTLTVEQLLPRARDLQTVIDANEWIGYHSGSFVEGLLASRGAKRLRPYSTADEYEKALSDGSVVAIVDEMPYIRSSLSLHPNFAVVERINHTGGLGFVFPKNSSLVSRVSQELLKLRESGDVCMIERKWFGSDSCSSTKHDPSLSNAQLTLRSFRWLYTFIVLASGVILIVFLIFSRKCEVVPINPGDHENDRPDIEANQRLQENGIRKTWMAALRVTFRRSN